MGGVEIEGIPVFVTLARGPGGKAAFVSVDTGQGGGFDLCLFKSPDTLLLFCAIFANRRLHIFAAVLNLLSLGNFGRVDKGKRG